MAAAAAACDVGQGGIVTRPLKTGRLAVTQLVCMTDSLATMAWWPGWEPSNHPDANGYGGTYRVAHGPLEFFKWLSL